MAATNFKNGNTANPSNVVNQMLQETERGIEKVTGNKVKLVVRETSR